MAVSEDERTEQNGNGSGGGVAHGALKAAAAAAATGAATLAIRKAMQHAPSSSRGGSSDDDGGEDGGEDGAISKGSSLLASTGSSVWQAASGALLPMAEDAAEAAGKYLAQNAPDVVRERIVPRFIEAFNESS